MGEVYSRMVIAMIARKNLSFSSARVQIKNISSIYRYHTNGKYFCILRKSVSSLSMKIQPYAGANLVPVAVLVIYCLTISWNSK